jgi:hypothetical protein
MSDVEQRRMTLLPAKAGTCEECAVAHKPSEPHNKDSLHYQYHFYGRHGRWPKWSDAIAHCGEKRRALWEKELRRAGVWS